MFAQKNHMVLKNASPEISNPFHRDVKNRLTRNDDTLLSPIPFWFEAISLIGIEMCVDRNVSSARKGK